MSEYKYTPSMVACAQIELRETQFLMADKARVSLETAFSDLLQAHAEIAEMAKDRDDLQTRIKHLEEELRQAKLDGQTSTGYS